MTRLRAAWLGTWLWLWDRGSPVSSGDGPCRLWQTITPPTILLNTGDPLNTRLWREYISSLPASVSTLGIIWDPPDNDGPWHTELGIPLDPEGNDPRYVNHDTAEPIPPPRQLDLPDSVRRIVLVLRPGHGLDLWQRESVRCTRGLSHTMTPIDDCRILAAICAGKAEYTVVGLDKMNIWREEQGDQEELFRQELGARCKALRTEARVECVSVEEFRRRAEWRDMAEMLYPDHV